MLIPTLLASRAASTANAAELDGGLATGEEVKWDGDRVGLFVFAVVLVVVVEVDTVAPVFADVDVVVDRGGPGMELEHDIAGFCSFLLTESNKGVDRS